MFVTTSTWQLAKKHIEALLCAQSTRKGSPEGLPRLYYHKYKNLAMRIANPVKATPTPHLHTVNQAWKSYTSRIIITTGVIHMIKIPRQISVLPASFNFNSFSLCFIIN